MCVCAPALVSVVPLNVVKADERAVTLPFVCSGRQGGRRAPQPRRWCWHWMVEVASRSVVVRVRGVACARGGANRDRATSSATTTTAATTEEPAAHVVWVADRLGTVEHGVHAGVAAFEHLLPPHRCTRRR